MNLVNERGSRELNSGSKAKCDSFNGGISREGDGIMGLFRMGVWSEVPWAEMSEKPSIVSECSGLRRVLNQSMYGSGRERGVLVDFGILDNPVQLGEKLN